MTAVVSDPVAEAARVVFEEGREVRLRVGVPITDQLLFELTQRFDGLWFEADRRGELVIRGVAGGWASAISAELLAQVVGWAHAIGDGLSNSATGGYAPPGAWPMIPSGSWMNDATFADLRQRGKEAVRTGYYPVIPRFVFEVRSPLQEVARQREKMEDWAAAGVALGVLVDPESRTVWLYRPDGDGFSVEEFSRPTSVSCEPEMPGLVLDFEQIWTFPWE